MPFGVLTVAVIFVTRQTPRLLAVHTVFGVTSKSSSLHKKEA